MLFKPEVTSFIKLFTKRVQMLGEVDPEVYEKAPWWEKRIYDLGERIIKDADGNSRTVGLPEPLPQQHDHRGQQHASWRWPWAR